MAKINELTSDVYNLISAGEVVVSPETLLKELIENSIDAKAKHISIYTVKGGISEIKIVDDGEGIEASEVEKAFKQHATSKILNKEDINKISTLGFRGEALASIALVSNTQMVTRHISEEDATFIELEGGKVVKKEVTASNVGTTITVTKLFYNMPARYKFLKDAGKINKEIDKLLSAFILSYPQIEFDLYSDGVKRFSHRKGNLIDAISSVYGTEFATNLISVNEKFDDFMLEGALAYPYIQKRNRSWQMLFINDRKVECDIIESAINGAYTDFVMKGFFPCYVLNLHVPYNLVDVNISPQKTVVKLERAEEIATWLIRLIKEILIDSNKKQEKEDIVEKEQIVQGEQAFENLVELSKTDNGAKDEVYKHFTSTFFEDKTMFYKNIINKEGDVKVATISKNKAPVIEEFKFDAPKEDEISHKLNSPSSIMAKVLEDNQQNLKVGNNEDIKTIKHEYHQTSFIKEHIKVVGVLFDTYIIVEQKESFYIIDQHAAHERFLFDKYIKHAEENDVPSQELLIPYLINTSIDEKAFLLENKENFLNMGIELVDSGSHNIFVKRIPTFLIDYNLKDFFNDILSNLQSFTRDKVVFRHQIATHACKSAIKANDVLSAEEIEDIINMVKNSNSPLLCPHGRPYVVNIKKVEVEKWFKRVL